MNKKLIIALSILAVMLVTVFAACKKTEADSAPTDDSKPYSTEENGDKFIINVEGDKIPVTTDAEGFEDDLEALYTQTLSPAQKEEQKNPDKKPSSTAGVSDSATDKPKPPESSTAPKTEPSTKPSGGGVQIGSGSGGSVDWNDIANA